MVFELVVDNGGMWTMVCNEHGLVMSFEEASVRGLAASWKDGKVVAPRAAEVVLFDGKRIVPRARKRPAIVATRMMQVRCKECGRFEEREFANCSVLGRLVAKDG